MKAGVVDYRMGNLASVSKALERVGAEAVVSDSVAELETCDLLVLPGVGNFTAGMGHLEELGLSTFIGQWAKDRPLLGICLGMQLLFESSEEGDSSGLGVLPGKVVRLRSQEKVPHMGWNTIASSGRLFDRFDSKMFYFVHSYICVPAGSDSVATTDYGQGFVSALASGNVFGVQFHPEKSSTNGLSFLSAVLGQVA